MKDLIEILNIFLKYVPNDISWPTSCSHDELTFCLDIELENVSTEDLARLEELGVFYSESDGCFKSFRYGSC
jgi:hypothetical protein